MTPKKVERDLRNLVDLLIEKDIAIASNPIAINRIDVAVRLTWHSPSGRTLGVGDFGTLENYRSLLQLQAYTVVLFDGSILQISYDFLGDTMLGHRLCYYPCPFDIDEDEIRVQPILDIVELYSEAGLDQLRLRSPIRFDFDPKNADDGHPAVHAHLIRSRCRCPIMAPLSLGHFVRFVFYHFYPELWQECEFLQKWPLHIWPRTITVAEESQLYIECRYK